MASKMVGSDEEYQPRKESAATPVSSDKAFPPSSNYSPPPDFVGYPPHNMGYPLAPGYPPNYIPYHPEAYPYAKGQPPPGAYYAVPPPYYASSSRGFFRGFILCSFLILVTFFLASFAVWFMLLPEAPIFRVEKLSVSNFSTSSSPFVVHFDINLAIENTDKDLKAYFDDFQQAIYHNNDIVSVSSSGPVALDTKERRVMNIKMSTNTSNEALVGRWVVDALNRDRATGSVTFILRLKVATAFKSGSMWTGAAELRVMCDDLKVQFVDLSGNGALDNSDRKPRICIVSI